MCGLGSSFGRDFGEKLGKSLVEATREARLPETSRVLLKEAMVAANLPATSRDLLRGAAEAIDLPEVAREIRRMTESLHLPEVARDVSAALRYASEHVGEAAAREIRIAAQALADVAPTIGVRTFAEAARELRGAAGYIGAAMAGSSALLGAAAITCTYIIYVLSVKRDRDSDEQPLIIKELDGAFKLSATDIKILGSGTLLILLGLTAVLIAREQIKILSNQAAAQEAVKVAITTVQEDRAAVLAMLAVRLAVRSAPKGQEAAVARAAVKAAVEAAPAAQVVAVIHEAVRGAVSAAPASLTVTLARAAIHSAVQNAPTVHLAEAANAAIVALINTVLDRRQKMEVIEAAMGEAIRAVSKAQKIDVARAVASTAVNAVPSAQKLEVVERITRAAAAAAPFGQRAALAGVAAQAAAQAIALVEAQRAANVDTAAQAAAQAATRASAQATAVQTAANTAADTAAGVPVQVTAAHAAADRAAAAHAASNAAAAHAAAHPVLQGYAEVTKALPAIRGAANAAANTAAAQAAVNALAPAVAHPVINPGRYGEVAAMSAAVNAAVPQAAANEAARAAANAAVAMASTHATEARAAAVTATQTAANAAAAAQVTAGAAVIANAEAQALATGRGTSAIKRAGSVWSEYHFAEFDRLLGLRLSGTSVSCSKVSVICEGSSPSVGLELSVAFNRAVVPFAYQAHGKYAHYVAAIVDTGLDSSSTSGCQVTYIDPENNPMPKAIVLALTQALPSDASVNFVQRLVSEQSYDNNCGPELIEHLAEAITGRRIAEDRVTAYHSELLADFLLQEAGHITPEIHLVHAALPSIASANGGTLVLKQDFTTSASAAFAFGSVSYNINNFVNTLFGPALKHFIYRADLARLQSMLKRYNVDMPARNVLNPKGFRTASLALHPDKGGATHDFAFVQSLKEKWNQDVDLRSLVDVQIQRWQPRIRTATVAMKVVDITVDAFRTYQLPTIDNAKRLTMSALHLHSICSSFGPFSLAASAVLVGNTYYEGGANQALQQTLVTVFYMAAPVVLAAASPYLAFAYSTALGAYTGYSVVTNAYGLYQSTGDVAHKLESLTAYRDNAQWLHNATGAEFLKAKVEEYDAQIHAMKYGSENLGSDECSSSDSGYVWPSHADTTIQTVHNITINGQAMDGNLVTVT